MGTSTVDARRHSRTDWQTWLRALMFVVAAQLASAGPPAPQVTPPGQPAAKKPPASRHKKSKRTASAPASSTLRRRLRCQHPANPLRRPFVCKDEPFDWEETLTRDWNTERDRLKETGITPTVSYYGVLQTNPTGDAPQMWGYVGQLTAGLDFNFERLAGVRGSSLYVSGSWGTGSNLTARIGSLFPVNPNYAPGSYLGETYLQQKLLDDKLTLAAGRLGANYTFAGLPAFANYVSFGIDPTPVSIVTNDLSFAGPPPGLEWGAQAIYRAAPSVELAAGVFNTSANSANNGNIFVLQQGNQGAMYLAQATYLHKQGPHDMEKPGEVTGGFFYDTNTFAILPNNTTATGVNYGVYLMGQQKVWEPSRNVPEGLTLWAAGTWSPKQIVSTMPWFAGAGLCYQGLVPRRKDDIVSAGWWYGKTSVYIPGSTAAQMVEVNYQWMPTKSINVIPDFQYIWRPTGFPSASTVVVGIQLTVTI
jgi:porin